MFSRYRLLIFAIPLMFGAGCKALIPWSSEYALRSPDGSAEIEVQRVDGLGDSLIRVRVVRGGRSWEIARRDDCSVRFAHAVWEKNRVAAFVEGTFCGQIWVAYDLATMKPIPFTSMREVLGSSIVKEYGVTAEELREVGGDVFLWADYHESYLHDRRSIDAYYQRRHGKRP